MKGLLHAQKVCKFWSQLINSSIHLRRALFLEPVKCGSVSYIDWRLDVKDWYNEKGANLGLGQPLRGPNRDQKPKIYPTHWGKARDDTGKYRVFINPLLLKMFPVLATAGLYWDEEFDALPKEVHYEHASWKKMYFTQPPINCLAVEWETADDEDTDADWVISQVRKRPDRPGLTMQDLIVELEALDKSAWIEGREMWEVYKGAEDLRFVEVGGTEAMTEGLK